MPRGQILPTNLHLVHPLRQIVHLPPQCVPVLFVLVGINTCLLGRDTRWCDIIIHHLQTRIGKRLAHDVTISLRRSLPWINLLFRHWWQVSSTHEITTTTTCLGCSHLLCLLVTWNRWLVTLVLWIESFRLGTRCMAWCLVHGGGGCRC